MVIPSRIALLLFGSGMCALIYQVTWLRELRLVFGASTPATATVLAVFMGGLGYGSAKLSRMAERADKPLALYAKLELFIALSAALTPILLWVVRQAYVALGGTIALGVGGGTIVRLIGSTLVLLPPTFLMGGTLPAAARAAESESDPERRSTALLYGMNTIGAVLGATLTTFLLIEVFGTRLTLWLGCGVNALVAVGAKAIDRGLPNLAATEEKQQDGSSSPPHFILGAACAVGLVFLLLELVWYRMLAPLLGGSTYTFGLILAVALLGVGLGGLLYTRRRGPAPTLATFASTCALEALFVAIPLALGDRLALLALTLRPLGIVGLWGHALGWAIVTAIVALPAAVVAGYQFPLLIALLGKGRENVARHVGVAYAWNTIGAITGSLAGGFFLLPVLTAPGAWRASVFALVALGTGALLLYGRRGRRRAVYLPSVLVLSAMAVAVTSGGPTAVWRHSPIGTGRADHVTKLKTRNGLRKWMRKQRYAVTWEAEGRESSVALHRTYDTAFIVNGKTDGSALGDATTQIMGGLLGALLHGDVQRSLVIGLGTGSTAGWLGQVPSMERVDVVEIEPAMRHVASTLGAVNANVLDNPKVRIFDGDAREVLLTQPKRYDLIFSEPSNPYRSGIASLFTRELYEAAHARLEPGGVFVQWLQGYDIDAESVAIVYSTLQSVFGSVVSWRADVSDLLLIASAEEIAMDVDTIEARMATAPFDTALMGVWRVNDIEGLLAHYVASPALASSAASLGRGTLINTDDRNLLEFSLARALGRPTGYTADKLLAEAEKRGMSRPSITGKVAWKRVAEERMTITMARDGQPATQDVTKMSATTRHRYRAFRAWAADRDDQVLSAWSRMGRPPTSAIELMVVADALAGVGQREKALQVADLLRVHMPTEALAIEARAAFFARDYPAARAALTAALIAYRADPWPAPELMLRALELVPDLALSDRGSIPALLAVLSEPFVTDSLRLHRELFATQIARHSEDPEHCVRALSRFEPHTPWNHDFLFHRLSCYERARHPLEELAREELFEFAADDARAIDDFLLP